MGKVNSPWANRSIMSTLSFFTLCSIFPKVMSTSVSVPWYAEKTGVGLQNTQMFFDAMMPIRGLRHEFEELGVSQIIDLQQCFLFPAKQRLDNGTGQNIEFHQLCQFAQIECYLDFLQEASAFKIGLWEHVRIAILSCQLKIQSDLIQVKEFSASAFQHKFYEFKIQTHFVFWQRTRVMTLSGK